MRLEVGPAEQRIETGSPAAVVAQVFNTDDVINAYEIRVFGVDPTWVDLERDRLSLFPSSAGVVTVLVHVPEDYPAGALHLGIEVTPLVDPSARQLGTVSLVVAPRRIATVHVDPQSLMAGRSGTFNLTFANDGNTPVELELSSLDPEAKVRSTFFTGPDLPKKRGRRAPSGPAPSISIVPGEQVIVPVQATARQPILGSPAARLVTFSATGADNPLETMVSFVQKPILGRGLMSVFGLLMAITVFALVMTTTLGRVADVAKVDAALLKRAVEGAPTERGIPDNPATITGAVTQRSDGQGVRGATVEAFPADDPSAPIASAVTLDDTGVFTVPNLAEGTYKLRFRGAGFLEIWFDGATTFEDAVEVDVAEGSTVAGINMVIGALPGSIAGTVIGDDPAGAVVSLQVPSDVGGAAALLQQVTVAADGAFLLEKIPAPASYELVVEKSGYSKSTRTVNLAAAEVQEGIELRLRRGDGLIGGLVTDAEGDPVGGVTVVATNTVDEVSTISLTNGEDAGRFTLRNLPTPATYTITFTKGGFATENLTVVLGESEEVGPELVQLARGTGSIAGSVSRAGMGLIGGVVVTVSDGEHTFVTETLSEGDTGTFLVTNLPIPGTYTVTFSGSGLAPLVRSVDLDPLDVSNAVGINALLTASTANVGGTVTGPTGNAVGGVAVELSDGTVTLTTRTADEPAGEYILTGIPPGTYTLTFRQTGAVPSSVLLRLTAGEHRIEDVRLKPQASITGVVRRAASGTSAAEPLAGVQVVAYRVAEFPNVVAATAITDASGRYVLSDLTAPDEYVVELSYPVGALPAASVRAELEAGETLALPDQTLTLAGSAS